MGLNSFLRMLQPIHRGCLSGHSHRMCITIWWSTISLVSSVHTCIVDSILNENNIIRFVLCCILVHRHYFYNYCFVYVVGYFWVCNFIQALGQCTMAGAVSSWYWGTLHSLHRFALITMILFPTLYASSHTDTYLYICTNLYIYSPWQDGDP